MSESRVIEAALDEHGLPTPSQFRSSQYPCEGAKFHSPRPLSTRLHVFADGQIKTYLCPTCEANLHVLLHLARNSDGRLDWTLLREFGNQLRALGKRILAASHG